jgi:alpha-mannosidase
VQQQQLHVAIKAWSGVLDIPPHRHFRQAQLVAIDEPTERFFYLADTLTQAVAQLDENDVRRRDLLRVLDQAMRHVVFVSHDSAHFYNSVAAAEAWLREELERMPSDAAAPKVIGVGHSHIDLAWLWRLKDTREKAARTFSTVLHLMRQYPEYGFLHSSPQLYKWVQEDYPEIFEHIEEMVGSGRWEATGGMWVEPDCNIPNGESLVRQIVWGKRYFRDTFGVDNHVLWLPDVFGYPWSLPQLMRKSGLDYFLTSKISWNQFNRFPHDTFTWRGIDGSEVLAHFITTPEEGDGSWHYTYNGVLSPHDVKGIWNNYRQKAINDELLLPFGWGDGGGGPTTQMIEGGRVLRSLPGFPRVELGQAEPFFQRLEQRLRNEDVPVWDGELYLEFHRGTYTSQANNKRANRKAEVLYHDAEWLSTLRDVLLHQQAYPLQALRDGWELLLLNQFHDILPGSSIPQVYEDSQAQYKEIEQIGNDVVDQAQRAVLRNIATEQPSVVVFNSLAWQRNGLVECAAAELAQHSIPNQHGATTAMQAIEQEGERRWLLRVHDVPALGYRAYPLAEQEVNQAMESLVVQPDLLENQFYRIALNEHGQLLSIWDKRHGREAFAPKQPGNVFQVFQDKPLAFDAWDIDIYYNEKAYPITELIEAVVEETGPLRGVLRLRWQFRGSTITQRATIYAHSPRIDFRTEVDWHEHQVLLKVAFPIAVRTSKATYDIQWGNIERPTHWNTSWDWARFESVAHKWVDLSEGNYGVALLNDCKYGHDIHNNIMRLTLLKAPVRPDGQADQGCHQFTYSLLPHGGDWREGCVAQHAYELNYPLRAAVIPVQPGGDLPDHFAFAACDAEHVIIETVKRAEDDDAWIVRAYEGKQHRNNHVAICFGAPIARAAECNLLEEVTGDMEVQDQQLRFAIAPYEIKTWKVWFR